MKNFFGLFGKNRASEHSRKKGGPKEKKAKPKKEARQLTDFEKFFFYRLSDNKEYKERRLKFAREVAPILIDGCGGIKNIDGVRAVNYAISIRFKNQYQVKEDVLRNTGGLQLKISNHEVTDIFDFPETKAMVSIIKKELKTAKSMFVKLNFA